MERFDRERIDHDWQEQERIQRRQTRKLEKQTKRLEREKASRELEKVRRKEEQAEKALREAKQLKIEISAKAKEEFSQYWPRNLVHCRTQFSSPHCKFLKAWLQTDHNRVQDESLISKHAKL